MSVSTIDDSKTNLAHLIEQAELGEDVVIARGQQPIVRLVPIAKQPGKRPIGLFKGKYNIPDDFFDPLPQGELDAWG